MRRMLILSAGVATGPGSHFAAGAAHADGRMRMSSGLSQWLGLKAGFLICGVMGMMALGLLRFVPMNGRPASPNAQELE